MGWNTRIILLVEGVCDEQVARATSMAKNDVQPFSVPTTACFLESDSRQGGKVIYISYERRKYLPYWTILELSSQCPSLYFTALASSPEFDSGPAGLLKMVGGAVVDSYGFWGERQAVVANFGPDVLGA